MMQDTATAHNGLTPDDFHEETERLLEEPEPLYKSALLDLSQEIPEPPIALQVGNETWGTLGNLSLVIGKAKSRKTFLMVQIVVWAIQRGIKPGKNRIVFAGTEQGKYHVLKFANRVLRLLPDDPLSSPPFDVYALRKYDTEQRKQILNEIIENTPDLGILIIDGVRDIVSSINDEDQATDTANWLLKQTEERQIHIITVLHQNKGDFNARGHLGSELVNKSELTVSVEKEKKNDDVSKVEVEYSRHKEFSPFAFRINDQGLPELVEGWIKKDPAAAKNEKLAPFEVEEYKHIEALQMIAKNIGDRPNYSEILQQIVNAVSQNIEKIGQTKAKEFFTHYSNEGFIEKIGKDRSPKTYYKVHPYGRK